MAGRERDSLIPTFVLPGPGYYDGEYTVTKSKPPVYSMRGKYKYLCDDNKPGPGAHCPEKVMSFVIHHIFPSVVTHLKLTHSTGKRNRRPRYHLALSIPSSQADRANILYRIIIHVVCEQIEQTKTIHRIVNCPLEYFNLESFEYRTLNMKNYTSTNLSISYIYICFLVSPYTHLDRLICRKCPRTASE